MSDPNPRALILLIDDDDDLAGALAIMLEAQGYRVVRAGDGEIGLRVARHERPDLILLDFMMPTMDGFDTCRQLRAIEGLCEVPILAMTAFGQNIGELYGLTGEGKPAVDDFMEKPVEPNILFERVAGLLEA
jgi:DNA-binding response OmpR family regulator